MQRQWRDFKSYRRLLEALMSYIRHMNYEVFLTDQLILNANAIYQKQTTANYLSTGGGVGYILDEQSNIILNAGAWYWSKNAIIPYAGFGYKNFQVGISYDITISKLNSAAIKPRSWEIALIIRGEKKDRIMRIIPCPWK